MFKELNTLKLFFDSPTKEFNVREISRKVKIAPATASKDLDNLSKKGILTKRKERNLSLFKANLDNNLYNDLKVFYVLRKIKESGLIEELNKFYGKPTLVLFGSVSNGLDVEDSDIDFLIISEKKSDFPFKEKYEKKLNKDIHMFIVKDIKEITNKHLINNMINGIVLQGAIKWI